MKTPRRWSAKEPPPHFWRGEKGCDSLLLLGVHRWKSQERAHRQSSCFNHDACCLSLCVATAQGVCLLVTLCVSPAQAGGDAIGDLDVPGVEKSALIC